jgi:hypothetical protein
MAEEEKKFGVTEPNQGKDGKLASQVTGESITGVFDYGDIKPRDKEVIQEVLTLIKDRPGVPADMIAEELKVKFDIIEIPMKRIEDSIWGQMTKEERLGMSIQGFRQSTDENGNQIRIPHVGFSADLDYLDDFINRIVQKALKLKKE